MQFEIINPKFQHYRELWYQNEDVLFNIIECLKYRETVLIRLESPTTIRCIKANAIQYLMMNFRRYKFFEQPYNLYQSLSIYPNMPMFSFMPNKRREQQDDFNDKYLDYMTGYDLLFDIDNEDLRLAYSTTYTIKTILDDNKIPYYLLFSGQKGFHIRVNYEDFSDELKQMPFEELCELFKNFAFDFQQKYNLPDLDISIFDLRRIAKTPYSVTYPYYFVALPLSDEQFNRFSFEMVSLPILLGKNMYNRGLLKRAGQKEALYKLIKETRCDLKDEADKTK